MSKTRNRHISDTKPYRTIHFSFSFKRHFGDRDRKTVPIRCYRDGDRTIYTAVLSREVGSGYEYTHPSGQRFTSPEFLRVPKGWQVYSTTKSVRHVEKSKSLAELKKKIWMHYRTLSGD